MRDRATQRTKEHTSKLQIYYTDNMCLPLYAKARALWTPEPHWT